MRTETDQKALSELTYSGVDMFEHTSKEAFRKRGTLVTEGYDGWYITLNEYPHAHRGKVQLIAWYEEKTDSPLTPYGNALAIGGFFTGVREDYESLHCTHSARTDQSVPQRLHFHLYTEK